MKNVISSISLVLLLFMVPFKAFASHMAGGELTYVCNSPNNYTVTLIMYRNCNAGFPLQIQTLFSWKHLNGTEALNHGDQNPTLEIISDNFDDPCMTMPEGICLEKGTYVWENVSPGFSQGVIELYSQEDALSDAFIANVLFPNNFGATYSATIPPLSLFIPCHDSPTFNSDPPAVLCVDILNEIDVSCTASNPNHTLEYEFFTPYDAEPVTDPGDWDPTINNWDTIVWEPGYNAEYSFGPEASNPLISTELTDDGTILLTITDESLPSDGMGFYNGVKVKEYNEDGELVSIIFRTYTYIIGDCNINVANIQLVDQNPSTGLLPCGDLTVNFANQSSNSNSFIWDFGDDLSQDNSSTLEFPTHTFSDYGTYDVSLISYSDSIECADTIVLPVEIIVPISGNIPMNANQCLPSNSFDFEFINDQNYPYSISWDFGPTANQSTSNELTPSGISFEDVGTFPIQATVSYLNCEEVFTTTVTVFDGLLDNIAGPHYACDPEIVTFQGATNNPDYEYTWYINDDTLIGGTVEYYFDEPGSYDIGLYILDPINGCESLEEIDNYITVFPTPISDFTVNDFEFTVGEQFQIFDNSINATAVNYFIPTEGFFSNLKNPNLVFKEPGTHIITQTVFNGECTGSTTITVQVSPRIPVIPNVFTPNGDLMNDFFYIDTHLNENVQLDIYDRWGRKVFSSDNYELCDPISGEGCWAGYNSFTNKKCNNGHYFYIVKLKTGESYKGSIHIL